MAVAYLVQHGEKEPVPGDPGLTPAGRQQASRTGRWLHGRGVQALYTSPMRRARETAEAMASVTGLAAQPDARPPQLLAAGIPPCAITTIDDPTVVTIASTAHLP